MNIPQVNWKILLLSLLGGLSLLALVIWRARVAAHPSSAQARVILVDPSQSVGGGNCECLQVVALRALAQRSQTNAATLSVLRTGDDASALEPVLVATYPIPATRQALERSQTLAIGREQLMSDLRQRCQHMQPTNRSPIFKAVMGSIAHLRAEGCGPGADCTLYVNSDLAELTEKRIRAAMKETKPLARSALPAPLDNAGIHVVFLGTANTIGMFGKSQRLTIARSPEQTRRMEEVWRALFTQPALVSFEPFCGAPTTPSVQLH